VSFLWERDRIKEPGVSDLFLVRILAFNMLAAQHTVRQPDHDRPHAGTIDLMPQCNRIRRREEITSRPEDAASQDADDNNQDDDCHEERPEHPAAAAVSVHSC